ncbi:MULTISPECIES: hypothetical protein [Streptomyces]|uniref:NUDIX hydrolase n=1 Tax=Streptomyces evansiae TaxID=3075535 RepID=A0ABD5EE59_9ACTN|nr:MULTISPECIES: hypothetical protein [unclassified Streptomyces]MYQ55747.1 hypothetical protein [Streptomyces sp. SID4926]EFK97973.1 predicted protein [Streptomyces sp. SPB78]MDT0412651.1 hypothetical protein [Streptomyces sp. DSM 41979]MDT0418877.1 hypothetical protein [Streptomyces sp. DSM 41982]SCD50943.1 hypothetical protein GA0115246_1025710 [Streptomyces sp. SolWspMP-sol7th]
MPNLEYYTDTDLPRALRRPRLDADGERWLPVAVTKEWHEKREVVVVFLRPARGGGREWIVPLPDLDTLTREATP